MKYAPAFAILCGCALLALAEENFRGWEFHGGTRLGTRYSTLRQIDRSNVGKLQVAWTFDTHDESNGSELECNPIVVDGVLYATTPKMRVIALDAATGHLKWAFDPQDEGKGRLRNRGVAWWGQGKERRIFASVRQYLYALDAATGVPVKSFGDNGHIDLRQGLGRDPESLTVSATSPGVVYKDLLIMGSTLPEDLPSGPGDIRAYDVRTGKMRWSFHTIPHPGEYGYDTWPKDAWKTSGGVNNWPGMSLDEKRGVIYVPTGSASFDFYGADRIGDDLFANCLLALRADTGERIWHFQVVKHDLWDRDLPAAPSLVTVNRGGKPVDAVAQITKSGFVFVFDRDTGKPLFPIEYRAVPKSDVDGEVTAATQPFPLLPPPFARQNFTEELVTRRTPAAHDAVLQRLRELRNGGQFLPPSLQGSVILPGLDGGGEWGGAAFDPETHLFYVNANERVQILRLGERVPITGNTSGKRLYVNSCAACHKADRTGGEGPALTGIGAKYSRDQIIALVRKGSGRMPAFPGMQGAAGEALLDYVVSGKDTPVSANAGVAASNTLKYKTAGYNRLYDPDGYPAIEPPWGTLNAINLDTGEFAWKVPLGEFPELAAQGLHTGSENYGGPVVTASGLLFIGATNYDKKFRAFDKMSGALLWETTLPAAGNATPAVYEVNGREYIVIAAGGGKNGAPSGGTYVAFALRP
jgi:quinoprotein glucose dehydrogenase